MAQTTRDRLIEKAGALFYDHGFHAVGLDQVLAEVGVTKTTFYNHFASKDDLILAAIQQRDEQEMTTWAEHIHEQAGDDPAACLHAVFDVLHEAFNTEYFRGCMFINAAAEFPSPHDPIRRAAAHHAIRFANLVRAWASDLGLADVDGFTREYMTILQGAITVRMVADDPDAALIAGRTARRLLRHHLETPATQPPVQKRPVRA